LKDDRKRAFYDAGGSLREMDVDVEEYVDAFMQIFASTFGERDGVEGFADFVRSVPAEAVASMPPFPFPKFLFPTGTFPEGMRFEEDGAHFVAPPKVMAYIDEHGEDALAELASALNERRMSKSSKSSGRMKSEKTSTSALKMPAEDGLREFLLEACAEEGLEMDNVEDGDMQAMLEYLMSNEGLEDFRAEVMYGDDNDESDQSGSYESEYEEYNADDDDILAAAEAFSEGLSISNAVDDPKRAWFAAAKTGALLDMREAYAADSTLLYERSGGIGHTAAHWVAARNHIDVLRWLVDDLKYDVDFRNHCEATALHAAAGNGQLECVKFLLDAGADVHVRDEIGETPCDVATRMRCDGEIIKLLNGGDASATHVETFCGVCDEPPPRVEDALSMEDVETVIIADSTPPSAESVAAMTAVHALDKDVNRRWLDAAKAGDEETMRLVYAENPDVLYAYGKGTSYGFSGNSAMHWCASKGHVQCMRWLFSLGFDIDRCRNMGDSAAAHSAAGSGNIASLITLIHEFSCDLELTNDLGQTPRDVAIERGDTDTARAIEYHKKLRAARSTFTRTKSHALKDAREVLNLAAVDDPALVGLMEKEEIVAAIEKLFASLPETAPSRTTKPAPTSLAAEAEAEASSSARNEQADETDALVAKAQLAKDRGNAAFAARDFPRAIKAFSMAIRLDRANHVLYSNRSAAYVGAGQFEQALADAQKCVSLAPNWGKAYARHACALSALGQHAEAVKVCTRGLARDPSSDALRRQRDASALAIRDANARYADMWGVQPPHVVEP
jgi:ankyrin repeat protein/Flp pilus assembly protein TadD